VGATPADAAKFLTFSQVGTLNVEVGKADVEIERIHHICFNVPNLHEESAPLIQKGCKVPFVYINNSLIEENHIDTGAVGGVIMSFRPDMGRSEREKTNRERLPISDWQFRGVGIGVNDLDKLVEYYQNLGIGSFGPEVMFDSGSIADFQVDGRPADSPVRARTRIAQVGPMTYEFTQPLEGETIYRESLDRRGEGVNDFIFTVSDLDAETAQLTDKGVSILQRGNPRNGGAYAIFDTRRVGNMMMKLVQA